MKTQQRRGSSRKRVALRGRRFTQEQREKALELLAAGMTQEQVAKTVGTTAVSVWRWRKSAKSAVASSSQDRQDDKGENKTEGAMVATGKDSPQPVRSPYAPTDPGQGLGEHEVAAILELKRRHPSMGPAQLRAQLKRFKGWRIALKAIARVLRGHGYEPVHRGSRPKGPEPIRFEAPRRNALWQADFAEVRVGEDRLHVLIILDDYSRFVVGHALEAGQ